MKEAAVASHIHPFPRITDVKEAAVVSHIQALNSLITTSTRSKELYGRYK
jgi:hypothetical protein